MLILFHILAGAVLAAAMYGVAAFAAEAPPAWAYPVRPPDFKPPSDNGSTHRVPGSSKGYTLTQTMDRFNATDWHPGDYPAMPEIVARGSKPGVFACGWCHRAAGYGGPENANLAGLPVDYFIQQIADYKNGTRNTSVARGPTTLMMGLVKDITDAEVEAAAKYFASVKPKQNIRLVETDSVPKTFVAGSFLADARTCDKEPIGQRIIEIPEDLEQFKSGDPRARFIAYAPIGSIKKGEALVTTGGGKTLPCAACHGADLKGAALVPPIAGRSPSYMVRQLYDFQNGARAGAGAAQMKPVVEKLTVDEMTAIAAYLTTRSP